MIDTDYERAAPDESEMKYMRHRTASVRTIGCDRGAPIGLRQEHPSNGLVAPPLWWTRR